MGLVFASPNVNTVFRHSADLNLKKHNYVVTLVLLAARGSVEACTGR